MAAKSKIGGKCGTELVLQRIGNPGGCVQLCAYSQGFFSIRKSFNKILNIDGVWFHTFYGSQSVKGN